MIDRSSRDILAETLRQYVSGRVTNDDLYDCITSFEDNGVRAVYEAAWTLYDDRYNHKATGKHRIDGEARDVVSRWICFLHTDMEYKWPVRHVSFSHTLFNVVMNFLTCGRWAGALREDIKPYGDYDYWPFISEEDYKEAMRNPKLLNRGADSSFPD